MKKKKPREKRKDRPVASGRFSAARIGAIYEEEEIPLRGEN